MATLWNWLGATFLKAISFLFTQNVSNKIASELLDLIHLNYRRVNCIVRNALRDYNKEIIVLILKIFHENNIYTSYWSSPESKWILLHSQASKLLVMSSYLIFNARHDSQSPMECSGNHVILFLFSHTMVFFPL